MFFGSIIFDSTKSPATTEAIKTTEIYEVMEHAKNGDVSATNRLVNHYLIFEADEKCALMWARLGAEQGDLNLRKFVVDVLSKSSLAVEKDESIQLANKWNLKANP